MIYWTFQGDSNYIGNFFSLSQIFHGDFNRRRMKA